MALSPGLSQALKQYYNTIAINDATYQDQPLYAMISKDEDFEGDVYKQPIYWADTPGRSATFANAQGNKSTGQASSFLVPDITDYALGTITTQSILASKGSKGAFFDQFKKSIDGVLHKLGRSIGISIYGAGDGVIGQVQLLSGAGPFTVQLTNPDDISHFEYSDTIVAAATKTGALRAGTGVITNIDRINGVLTLSSIPTGFANNDFMFIQGDAANGSTTLLRAFGVQSWIVPASVATAASFCNVARGTDSRLFGNYVDLSGTAALSTIETINRLQMYIWRLGGRPRHLFCSGAFFEALNNDLMGKSYLPLETKVKDSSLLYEGIKINGIKGPIEVYADINCPPQFIFMPTLDKWSLFSRGKAPFIFKEDGNLVLREATSDGVEIRGEAFYNVATGAPGMSGLAKVA